MDSRVYSLYIIHHLGYLYQVDTLLGQFNVDEVIHDSTSSAINKITFENEGFWTYSFTSLAGGQWTMWENFAGITPSITNFGVAHETVKYNLTNHNVFNGVSENSFLQNYFSQSSTTSGNYIRKFNIIT